MYAIGLNSGSSFDGVDAVLIDIDFGEDGQLTPPRFIDGISVDWPEDVGQDVLAAFANDLSIFELTRLNYVVGAIFADAARRLMDAHSLSPEQVTVIGYDGQTIYQEPPDRSRMGELPTDAPLYRRFIEGGYAFGLQIGEPGVVAGLLDIPVVTQFRSVDHTLGGTGAPLMQFLDFVAFRSVAPIATLNIGGISNVQIADADRSRMRAFDCGPGNVMIDHAMRVLFGREYDESGQTAARGHVDGTMLTDLLAHPFFERPVPRCAWRLDFGADYADSVLSKYDHLAAEDIIATLTRFSAEAIVRALTQNVPQLDEIDTVIYSGGGARNTTMVEAIRELLPDHLCLRRSDDVGLPAQFKEAIKFATLATATLYQIGNNIPAASGAVQFGILGKLVQAPRNSRLVPTVSSSTTRQGE